MKTNLIGRMLKKEVKKLKLTYSKHDTRYTCDRQDLSTSEIVTLAHEHPHSKHATWCASESNEAWKRTYRLQETHYSDDSSCRWTTCQQIWHVVYLGYDNDVLNFSLFFCSTCSQVCTNTCSVGRCQDAQRAHGIVTQPRDQYYVRSMLKAYRSV